MGIFDTLIVRPFGLLLMWIYSIVNNYGLAIIIFATIAKLILLPFSYKSKKSMAQMSRVQEKVNKLQKQYANNRVKLNEEITKLYEREGISPMSGCLPSFLPLPIMFGLYYAVQKPLTYMMGFLEKPGTDIALLANAVGITDLASQNAYTVQITIAERLGEFFDASGKLMPEIANLSSNIANYLVYIDFDFFGLNLAQQPSFTNPSVLWVIPILSGLTAFLSSFLTQKMQGSQLQGSMKIMLYVMPLMSVYFGFILPASVGIYWITNNVLMVVQEFCLGKFIKYREKKNPPPEPPEDQKKKKKKEA
ncbi:MAG: YidC/Oxa1 family membrane protein insertase [Clostridiaceae bacterium]|jgi:YidC/Oxa1 family membrane protein insertase|nr:YidC/Oxa1 family membrane protein insertase [Clostridiaceae bacterium]NBH79587.1 membrane protein insertase YidC [Clostridiaceae bacterium]NBI81834.1 membrane protein insertase YidC [Clostridiaceae bacterium]